MSIPFRLFRRRGQPGALCSDLRSAAVMQPDHRNPRFRTWPGPPPVDAAARPSVDGPDLMNHVDQPALAVPVNNGRGNPI